MLPFCSPKTRITVFPYLTGKAFSWVFSYWVRSIFWDSSTKSMQRETKALAPKGNRQGRGRAEAGQPQPWAADTSTGMSQGWETTSPRVVPVSAGSTARQGSGRAGDTLQHHWGGRMAPSWAERGSWSLRWGPSRLVSAHQSSAGEALTQLSKSNYSEDNTMVQKSPQSQQSPCKTWATIPWGHFSHLVRPTVPSPVFNSRGNPKMQVRL